MNQVVARRPGRKRKSNVVRFPCGQIVTDVALIERPYNMENVVERGDERVKTKGYQRQTALQQLVLDKSLYLAGEEFARLAELCRRHAWDSPKINPKVSSPESGHGHEPAELSDEVIALGERVHRRYTRAVEAVRVGSRRGALRVLGEVCLENKMPTADQRGALKDGLSVLARLWGL
jgi:hypothetical protein